MMGCCWPLWGVVLLLVNLVMGHYQDAKAVDLDEAHHEPLAPATASKWELHVKPADAVAMPQELRTEWSLKQHACHVHPGQWTVE